MTEMNDETPQLVLVTYPEDIEPGPGSFAESLVADELAACANVLDGVDSYFHWEGSLEQASEVLLLLKTSDRVYNRLEAAVRERHPYDEPEVIGFEIDRGADSYLNWVLDSLLPEEDAEQFKS